MYGGALDEALAERLIASVRGREDELPLLQHGLMLMWEDAVRRARAGRAPDPRQRASSTRPAALPSFCPATQTTSWRRPRPTSGPGGSSRPCSGR